MVTTNLNKNGGLAIQFIESLVLLVAERNLKGDDLFCTRKIYLCEVSL